MTEEQTEDQGQAALDLMNIPVFAATVLELSQQLVQAILESDPRETKARDSYYYQHKALRALLDRLNELINLKAQQDAQNLSDVENAELDDEYNLGGEIN